MLADQPQPGQDSQHKKKMDQDQKIENFLACLWRLSEIEDIGCGVKKQRRYRTQIADAAKRRTFSSLSINENVGIQLSA